MYNWEKEVRRKKISPANVDKTNYIFEQIDKLFTD